MRSGMCSWSNPDRFLTLAGQTAAEYDPEVLRFFGVRLTTAVDIAVVTESWTFLMVLITLNEVSMKNRVTM
jgi:hypothetical protein